MRKKQNRTIGYLAAAALVLSMCAASGKALAYFTTYASASGSAALHLGFTTTETEETVSDWTKHIRIRNTGDYDCYIRVKVFAGEKYQDALQYQDAAGVWTPGEEGYYYCQVPVAPGESTDELQVKIDSMESTEDFNVIVVQECTAVLYDGDGNPYADWTVTADAGEVQE